MTVGDGAMVMAIVTAIGGALLGVGMRRIERRLESIDRLLTDTALHKHRLDGLDGLPQQVAGHEARLVALERVG